MIVSDIITEYGAYYQDRGQNIASLYQVARTPFASEAAFEPIVTDDTIWTAGKTTFERIVQPFQKAFTPTGTVTFKPVGIQMFHHKADTSEYPDDLEASWLGFLAKGGLKRTEWPFIKWYLETQYFPQIQQDLELNEIAKGSFVAPTPGTPGAVSTSMDGYKKILAAHITAGRTTPIVMGAVPTDPVEFVNYVETFADSINPVYWTKPMSINMSQALERRYYRGKERKYGQNTALASTDKSVQYANLDVRGLPSMVGASRLWCTPVGNAVMTKKKTQNQKLVDIQAFDRQAKFMSDWWLGIGFILPEIVFCTDVA